MLACWSTVMITRSAGSAELAGNAVEDADVGLVRHQPVDVGQRSGRWRRPPPRRPRPGWRRHGGTLPCRTSAGSPPSASRTGRRRHRGCRGSGRRSGGGSTGCRAAGCRPAPPRLGAVLPPRQHHGAGAVAEQHAGAAVLPVEDARVGLGADHQRRPHLPALDEVVGDRQREDEARAYRLHVEGGAAGHAELGLHARGRRREGIVRRAWWRRRSDRRLAARGRRPSSARSGGARRQVGGQLAVGRDVPLADAGAGDDPLVGGVQLMREFGVGQHPLRQVGAAADDLRP